MAAVASQAVTSAYAFDRYLRYDEYTQWLHELAEAELRLLARAAQRHQVHATKHGAGGGRATYMSATNTEGN